MKNKEHNYYRILLVLAMMLWGGGWSALKILTYNHEMEVIVFWRFFFMSLAFIPLLFFFKVPFSLNTKALKFISASSVLNIAFMVSSFFGVKYGLAGSGGVIITALSPLFTFILVWLLFRKNLTNTQLLGLFVGIFGAYILLADTPLPLFFQSGNGFFVLCAVIWAGVTLLSQYSHPHIHPLHYSFIISVIASVVTFVYAYTIHAPLGAVFTQDAHFWIALIYLAVFGQAVATTIFFLASGKLGSQETSSYMFLVPIFALGFAAVILNEPFKIDILLGGTLSMSAVYFINKTTN